LLFNKFKFYIKGSGYDKFIQKPGFGVVPVYTQHDPECGNSSIYVDNDLQSISLPIPIDQSANGGQHICYVVFSSELNYFVELQLNVTDPHFDGSVQVSNVR